MSATVVPLLVRRRIEAEILGRVFRSLCSRIGEKSALDAIGEAVEAAARDAGRAFAASAPDGPCLEHFETVLERWREGRALSIEGVCSTAEELSFVVTRCAYAELYRSLGLPEALAYTLSCRRDGSFAAGYAPQLSLERSATLVEGSDGCRFRFVWDATATYGKSVAGKGEEHDEV